MSSISPRPEWLRFHERSCMDIDDNRYVVTMDDEMVQEGHEHFVIDGHHRVALARERGMVAMDAIVTCRCPSGSV